MLNLDAMSADDLMKIWSQSRSPRKLARELWPDVTKGGIRAAREIGHYASNKATAIRCREKGDIEAAQTYELICERIYDDLPAFAIW